MFDMFSGGALGRMTVFALNIMPYISASIIVQLLSTALPSLEALKKEGDQGRKKLNQYTRYLTVLIALFQAYGIAMTLQRMTGNGGVSAVVNPGYPFIFTAVLTLVGGTMFLIWLGEQITARVSVMGILLDHFCRYCGEPAPCFGKPFPAGLHGALSPFFRASVSCPSSGHDCLIVFMEQRKGAWSSSILNVRSAAGCMGRFHPYAAQSQYSGRDPTNLRFLRFADSRDACRLFRRKVGGWLASIGQVLSQGQPLYMVTYAAMILFFSYFYAAVSFNPEETAENLRKQSGFVPGIRPGSNTARYFDRILTRLTTIGGIYLVAVCLLPQCSSVVIMCPSILVERASSSSCP